MVKKLINEVIIWRRAPIHLWVSPALHCKALPIHPSSHCCRTLHNTAHSFENSFTNNFWWCMIVGGSWDLWLTKAWLIFIKRCGTHFWIKIYLLDEGLSNLVEVGIEGHFNLKRRRQTWVLLFCRVNGVLWVCIIALLFDFMLQFAFMHM